MHEKLTLLAIVLSASGCFEDDPSAPGQVDADGDGVVAEKDCDDSDPNRAPGRRELCDGIDNDCNERVDDNAEDAEVFYADVDADGFGDPTTETQACEAPAGYVRERGDCDDSVSSTYPGAPELCDGIDNDCNFEIDDGVDDSLLRFLDSDQDGFGNANEPVKGCAPPEGYVADGTDCDDSNPEDNPTAVELCDGRDNNCDSRVD
ncbi:MAG: putative metal-binding motif-containing protein, partial [Myxococcota bacterium]